MLATRVLYTVRFPFILFLVLFLASCQNGCNRNNKPFTNDTSSNPLSNDPMLVDTIAPTSIADTANLDEYGKDSLKLSALFQHAANQLSQAYLKKDAATYCQFTPPIIIKTYGSARRYQAKVQEVMDNDSFHFERIVSGPVKRVQAAVDNDGYGHGWYCLMPVRRFRKINGKPAMELQWLGGQTLDMGKTIYFLDVTGKPREQILQIMPDLRFVLDQEAM